MNEQIDIVNLLKDKSALIKYILGMILSSEKFAVNLPQLRLVALLVVQSSDFDGHVADMMIKMGRGDEALKAMFDAKLKGKG